MDSLDSFVLSLELTAITTSLGFLLGINARQHDDTFSELKDEPERIKKYEQSMRKWGNSCIKGFIVCYGGYPGRYLAYRKIIKLSE